MPEPINLRVRIVPTEVACDRPPFSHPASSRELEQLYEAGQAALERAIAWSDSRPTIRSIVTSIADAVLDSLPAAAVGPVDALVLRQAARQLLTTLATIDRFQHALPPAEVLKLIAADRAVLTAALGDEA